jgi:phage terminase large subunit
VTPAQHRIADWRRNPIQFVYDQFKAEPDTWQAKVLTAFADPAKPRIAMKACAGPGKTTTLAWCGWNFMSCYAEVGEHPKGAAISITRDSLDAYLWPELAKWRDRSPFLQAAFEMNSERIYARDHPQTWFLEARGWPKTATPEEMGKTLSGLHSLYPLILADESGAIPTPILRAGDQALSRCRVGKFLQAGNPLSREGMLFAAYSTLAHQWFTITVTGDPDDPEAWVHSSRVVKELGTQPADWARQQIATYGRDNPWVQVYILGNFPASSLNSLLGEEDVKAAMARDLPPEAYNWANGRLGVDVARFGDDRTVYFPRQGRYAHTPEVMRHIRDSAVSTDIATKILALREEYGYDLVIMDATGGWAAGARDVLKASGHEPVSVQFHTKGFDQRYKNRRAEMWFAMSEWVKSGGRLPHIPELVAELTEPTYSWIGGQFLLEPKEQVKARIGRSPDLADALALTFGVVDARQKKKAVGPQFVQAPGTGSWMGG